MSVPHSLLISLSFWRLNLGLKFFFLWCTCGIIDLNWPMFMFIVCMYFYYAFVGNVVSFHHQNCSTNILLPKCSQNSLSFVFLSRLFSYFPPNTTVIVTNKFPFPCFFHFFSPPQSPCLSIISWLSRSLAAIHPWYIHTGENSSGSGNGFVY